jgi:fucose 4-O-acetylase-like acetyltransferase
LERIKEIDSLKGLLIVLVIFGHLVEGMIHEVSVARDIYVAIYLFHMPLFVMVAGIFAKPTVTRRDLDSLLERILLPLIVFQLFYLSFSFLKTGNLPSSIFQPYWVLWFLLSIALWRITLPTILRLKMPLLLLTSTTAISGYDVTIGYTFSLSRTIYFAPFFFLGFCMGKKSSQWPLIFRF